MRARAAVLLLAVCALTAVGSLADAQLPPPPAEAGPVTDVLSPTVHPQCGNAILAATIAASTLPPELREPAEVATANVIAACGYVPRPSRTPTRCAADETVTGAVNQAGGAAIGGALPVAPPTAGQVVDTVAAIEALAAQQLGPIGIAASVAGALSCTLASAPPAAPPSSPETDSGTFIPNPPEGAEPSSVFPTIPLGPGLAPVALDVPPYADVQAAEPVAASPSAPRDVSYPVFLVPIVLLGAGVVLTRGLLTSRASV
jgi:hypothetical protein